MILGIETSCDDTSVALVDLSGDVKGMKSLSQDAAHRPFGGVVPEVASRQHSENLLVLLESVLEENKVSWSQISGLAVTSRPGLVGSLLVGLVTAKTLSVAKQIPFVGVNHIEGHLLAPLLHDEHYSAPVGFTFPYLALAVSGGHTHLFHCERPGRYVLLGQTHDDAAGEAFDKLAKLLGLGFPGGANVDLVAKGGDPAALHLPRALLHDPTLNFSFSGLKTAAAKIWHELPVESRDAKRADLCASFQEAVVEVLLAKMERASRQIGAKRWTITGGVSANSRLRSEAAKRCATAGLQLALPPLRYCTDNAAMIGLAGLYRLRSGESSQLDLAPSASAWPTDWIT